MHDTMTSELVPEGSLLLQKSSSSDLGSANTPIDLKSPQRLKTDPEGSRSSPNLRMNCFKRLVVFCDGTWQDGLSSHEPEYTNVLRLSRAVNYKDERYSPPIPQIVYYQPGIGTENNFHSKYVDGATGRNLAAKVEEAYAFIAHNYSSGDEIFLFGFSRGAYTARMVAMFIGEIGVLDRRDMDHFAEIFHDFQKLGECDAETKNKLKEKLAPWRKPDSRGKLRADIDGDKFTIKCLGVWDTVGALGVPKELMPMPTKKIKLFGFHDRYLGEHIQYAFQAMALHEMRSSFNINKFIQPDASKAKNQILRQCWFAGCHTDVGGGYEEHDLSDISLVWMAGQIESILSLDLAYLESHFKPVAEWGKQRPHDSATGIFVLANKTSRKFPKGPNDPQTHESFHASILEQEKLCPVVNELLAAHPTLVAPLTNFERQIKRNWPYDPNSARAQKYGARVKRTVKSAGLSEDIAHEPPSWLEVLKTIARSVSFKGQAKQHAVVCETFVVATSAETVNVGAAATLTMPRRPPQTSHST